MREFEVQNIRKRKLRRRRCVYRIIEKSFRSVPIPKENYFTSEEVARRSSYDLLPCYIYDPEIGVDVPWSDSQFRMVQGKRWNEISCGVSYEISHGALSIATMHYYIQSTLPIPRMPEEIIYDIFERTPLGDLTTSRTS